MTSITRISQNVQGARTPFDSYSDVFRVSSDELETMSRDQLLHLCIEQQSLLVLVVSIVYSRMTDISTRLVALDLVLQAVQKNVRKSIGSITESMPVLIGGSPRNNKSCKPCKHCATNQEYERETTTHFVYSCQCGKTKTSTAKGIADRLGIVRNTVSSACDAMVASGALAREYRPGIYGKKQHLDVAFQPAFLDNPGMIQNKTVRKERTAPTTKKSETCPVCGSEDVDVMKAHACHACQQVTQTLVKKAHATRNDTVQQMPMNEHEVEATVQPRTVDASHTMTQGHAAQPYSAVLVMENSPRSITRTEQPSTFPTADVLPHNIQHATQQRDDVTLEYMDDTPPHPRQTLLLHAALEEPDMHGGRWSNEKCVQYAEWKNKKRCRDSMRPAQLAAAGWLQKQDPSLTLEQFKLAYDELFTWWREHNGPLHVSDMKVKQKNNIIRLYAMLDRIEAREKKGTTTRLRPQAAASAGELRVPSSAGTSEQGQGGEQVLWSPLPHAILDPLEYFESFRYMSISEAETYGYAPFKKLVPMDENNVLGKQRGLAAAQRAEKGDENESR